MELNKPYFHDDQEARKFLESKLWPHGPVCPHCRAQQRIYHSHGRGVREGVYRCNNCDRDFTVTVGTVMEGTHLPLRKWLMAIYLFTVAKKGISAKELQGILEVTYKTAWYLSHRIREAIKENFSDRLGGDGRIVEADETFWGTAYQKPQGARGYAHKMKVVTLVERDGPARSFVVGNVDAETVAAILEEQVHQETVLNTDEAAYYKKVGKKFAAHESVNHAAGEYARGVVSTNTVEGFFSLFKRGLIGTYHKVGSQHLSLYCAEFDFRWNTRALTTMDRMSEIITRFAGVRVKYGGKHKRTVAMNYDYAL
jgi:transposase-like protein